MAAMDRALLSALVAVAVSTALPVPARAVELTGAIIFSADANGDNLGGQIWNTSAVDDSGHWNLYLRQGATFINSGNASLLEIDIPLLAGLHTFDLFGDSGYDMPYYGLNLFFQGDDATPAISAMLPVGGAFATNLAPNTFTLQGQGGPTVPAASSLSAHFGGWLVTLTSFTWNLPSAGAFDLVSPYDLGANSHPDSFGSLSLQVTFVREPPSLAVFTCGLLLMFFSMTALEFRRRQKIGCADKSTGREDRSHTSRLIPAQELLAIPRPQTAS